MASSGQHNEVVVEQILKSLKAEQHGDNRWRGLCPAHDDHTPSLDIYVNADGYPGFSCLSKHCKHLDIVKAIKTKFNITVPSRKSGGSSDKIQSAKVLYPAHESTFPLHMRKDEDTIYEYVTASGEPAFFVQRYMDGKHKQTPAWFSVEYVSDGGRVERAWSSKDPPNKDRPLYNLYELAQNPDKKVLVVEGEKTADAAADYKQLADFVVVTWSGGSNRVKASDWSVLRDRTTEIYLWPDHDAEGIKAMKEVAKYINNGTDDQRISLLDYSEFIEQRIDKGWDLADGCANMICDYPFEELWGGFKPYYVNEHITNETLEEALAKRDKWYRKLRLGGRVLFLDVRKESEQSPFGLVYADDARTLALVDTEKVNVEVGDKVKTISVAKEWAEEHSNEAAILYGTVFDPATTVKEVIKEDGLKYLNTFPGFKVYPSDSRHDKLAVSWVEHLKGIVDDEEKTAVDWIIDYFADIFQNPAKKPGTALALLGGQGVGKSVIIQCVAKLLGTRLTRIINKDIIRNNIALSKSLLVYQDEWSINPGKEKLYYEALKNYVTSTRIKVEEKYLPAWEADSICRFAFTSNDAKPIRLPPDDRRFTMIHCNRYWLGNKQHFKSMFDMLEDKFALGGFLDFFKNRKIISDLTIGCNTKQKDTLWEPENKAIAELIQWADGNGLPEMIREKLGQVTNGFGEEFIYIPRIVMREYMVKTYGQYAYSNSDVTILKRILPSTENKKRIPIFDRRGAESRAFDLCFIVPPLRDLRINIESELNRPYPWNDKEILLDPNDVVDSNVIPLRRDIKDSPV
jgi:hypothetical protein